MNPNEPPDAAEFGLMRAYLARAGFSQAWIGEHTDTSLTRAENADMLKAAMKESPKDGE